MNLSHAAPIDNAPHSDMVAPEKTLVSQSGPLALYSSDLGLLGPLSIGMGYGSLDQFSVNAQYTKKINASVAASLLGEYGPEMYRFGGTLGAKFFNHGFGKISAEQFSQELPFDFDSGSINKSVKQNAYGARYQQIFDASLLKNINGGIYYANAPNVSLDPVLYDINGMQAINYRHIAGGTSTGLDLGSDFHLTPATELSAQLYYDHLRYDTKFTADSEDNAQGLGGALGIKQLLGNKFAISAVGSVREIYNTYTAGISWLPPLFNGAEISLLGQSIVSHNDTPNNESIGLQLGYNFGAGGIGARYALSNLTTTQDVGEWTNTPAVYMEQVLAIAEQYSEYVDPVKNNATTMQSAQSSLTSISPQGGPFSGNTKITVTGMDLNPCTYSEWYCVQIALIGLPVSLTNIHIASDHNSFTAITPAVANNSNPRTGDLIVDNRPDRLTLNNAFTFTNPPTLNAISGSTSGGEILFTGENLGGLSSFIFNGQETSFYAVTSNSFKAKIPAGTLGQVPMKVVTYNNAAQLSGSGSFTYIEGPAILSVDPNEGSTIGGTTVMISGKNFNGAFVKFGDNAGSNVQLVPGGLTVVTPPSAAKTAGSVHVIVITPNGTAIHENGFTYLSPAPIIDPEPSEPTEPAKSLNSTHHLESTHSVNSLASAAMNTVTPKILNTTSSTIFVALDASRNRFKVGESVQAIAEILYQGANAPEPVNAAWYSSDPAIATIDHRGKIIALAPGIVTMIATINGLSRGLMLEIVEQK